MRIGGKEVVTYLGGQLDQNLSGVSMAQKILQKSNAGLKFLYRKRLFLNMRCKKILCMAMIQSRLDYACNFYYHSLPNHMKSRLQVIQNKMIRFIMNYGSREHLNTDDFKKVKWLNIENRVKYLAVNHMYKCLNGQAPEYMQVFTRVNESHRYNTRSSSDSVILPQFGSFGLKSFKYIGAKIWNSLPNELKWCESKDALKIKCKEHLFSEMEISESDIYLYY